ncbi:MAG: PP2C family protein-serine/threonine phosphatase [Phycisphaerales bacterium]
MPETSAPASALSSPHQLACLEVWGGSRAFEGWLSVPGNDVHVSCVPHDRSLDGGDLYYVSNCAAGAITRFVLADVSGHGEGVARVAAQLRSLMRRHINTADQSVMAAALNAAFSGLDLNGRFATALLATYFAPTDHLIICNAGHPRPLHFSARGSGWRFLDSYAAGVKSSRESARDSVGIANLPLGVLHPSDYEQYALPLGRDDVVVLYTDAFIECRDPSGQELGESGLLALLNELGRPEPDVLPGLLRDRLREHAGGTAMDDDATLLALTHNAADPPRAGLRERLHALAAQLGFGGTDSGPA